MDDGWMRERRPDFLILVLPDLEGCLGGALGWVPCPPPTFCFLLPASSFSMGGWPGSGGGGAERDVGVDVGVDAVCRWSRPRKELLDQRSPPAAAGPAGPGLHLQIQRTTPPLWFADLCVCVHECVRVNLRYLKQVALADWSIPAWSLLDLNLQNVE